MPFLSDQIKILKKGNFEDIISLIEQGYDKNKILRYVCIFGYLNIVRYIIEKYNVDDDFPVIYASKNGHFEMVKYLVEERGADARAENDDAVRLASKFGHLKIVKYLVENCEADIRANSDYAVRWASWNGHLQVVRYLVEQCGVDVRVENNDAVRKASAYGHFEVVKYLVEKCGAVLPTPNPRYDIYISVCKTGERRRKYNASKRIYFWWVQACYNPSTLTGQRSMYKGYREYLNIR